MGGGSWKVAYADFTTAMMSFFLLMWLLNVVDEETKKGLAGYFSSSGQYGATTTASIANNPLIQFVDKLDQRDFRVQEAEQSNYVIAQALKQFLLQDSPISSSSGVTTDGIGVLLNVASKLMFKPGTMEFTDEGMSVLDEVVTIISKYKVYLVVRGHADSSESVAPFKNLWDLSAARANSAIRYLVSRGVDQKLLRSISYADTRPLAAPGTPNSVSKNARVEFNFHRPEVMSSVVGY